MKPIRFIRCTNLSPTGKTLPLPLEAQDAIRRSLPAADVSYQEGEFLLSREGVLHLVGEIIEGRKPGNINAARALKDSIMRDYPGQS